jgi:hypothetical protein
MRRAAYLRERLGEKAIVEGLAATLWPKQAGELARAELSQGFGVREAEANRRCGA